MMPSEEDYCTILTDFDSICRICLKKSKLQPIYCIKNKSLENQDIPGKLRLCCGIDVQLGDNLPSNICDVCSSNLLCAYELRRLSENSDRILKIVLQSNEDKKKKQMTIYKKRKKKLNKKESKTKKKYITAIDEGESNECEENVWDDDDDNNIFEDPSDGDDDKASEGSCEYSKETDVTLQQGDDDIQENDDEQDQSIDHLLRDISQDARPNDNKNICPICDIKIIKCNLKKHLVTHHSTMIKKGYKCYGCDQILNTRTERELHEDLYCSKMPPGTMYECSVCEATVSNREDFDKHLWIRHRGRPPPKTNEDGELPDMSARKDGYVCESCGQVLRSLTAFNQHVMRHQGKLWLECNLCSFRTSDYRSIMVHKLRHEGRKPFECQECPYKTDRVDYLKVHQMRHSGERPYSCPYCDYKAVNHSNLKKHKVSHSNVREFQCKGCEKFYKSNRALKQHVMRTHENVRMFYCKPCHTKYIGEEGLIRHIEKKHPSGDSNIIQETPLYT